MAVTIEGALFSTKMLFLGGAVMVPSFYVFVQHYFELPLPKVVNYVNVILAILLSIIMWIPQLRPLICASIYVYPEYSNNIFNWGVTPGVLYPFVRMHHIAMVAIIMLRLAKKLHHYNMAQRKIIIILVSYATVYIVPNSLVILYPDLYIILLFFNMPLISGASVALYLKFFRYAMLENEEAVRLQKSINDIVANISHDLKTPLTVLSVNLEKLLKVLPEDSTYSKYTKVAYNKNLDLQRLIHNLIEVTRIDSIQNLYNPKWLSLNDLLADINKKYSSHLESIGLTFDVVGGSSDRLIYADPIKIWSVFDNIIYNAIRHTQAGGITVTACTSAKDIVTIKVTDTGCGITKDSLPRIFERFFKVEPSRGTQSGESGLGLYIVKSIMEKSNGKVHMESEEGVGTSVILTFICYN